MKARIDKNGFTHIAHGGREYSFAGKTPQDMLSRLAKIERQIETLEKRREILLEYAENLESGNLVTEWHD